MPQASRLEEELRINFKNANIKLIKSSGGTFQVIVNGEIIFDKLALSKTEPIFPKMGDIPYLIKRKFS